MFTQMYGFVHLAAMNSFSENEIHQQINFSLRFSFSSGVPFILLLYAINLSG